MMSMFGTLVPVTGAVWLVIVILVAVPFLGVVSVVLCVVLMPVALVAVMSLCHPIRYQGFHPDHEQHGKPEPEPCTRHRIRPVVQTRSYARISANSFRQEPAPGIRSYNAIADSEE